MRIKQTVEKVPGGLMVVPLLLGALLNTLDQAHVHFIESFFHWLGAAPQKDGHVYFLQIGGFTSALFKDSALTLIALFLFCAGSQMNLRVGGRALKKGVLITATKYLTGLAIGYLFSLFFNPFDGMLGLSTMAIIAAMTNSNGGMFAALTGQYGNRSDVGSVAILSLNDGPFFTLLALGMMGNSFPIIAFIAVLLPILIGMILGNLDEDTRNFLKPGETLPIPFFAFALGAGMNFASFLNPNVVGAGLTLGVMTTVLTGGMSILVLWLFREKSQIAGISEASTAGNAAGTPAAIAAAAAVAASNGAMSAADAAKFHDIANLATIQISISTLTTAILCPLAVILWDRVQRNRGIIGTEEFPGVNVKKNDSVAS